MALLQAAAQLTQRGELLDSLPLLEEAARLGEGASSGPAREQLVAVALYSQGWALGQLGRADEELAVYARLVERFTTASDSSARLHVAMGMFNKAVRLAQIGRTEDAARAHGELIARFRDAPEEDIQVQVAMALYNGGGTLGLLDRPQEELRHYDELNARFGSSTNMRIRREVAHAARPLLMEYALVSSHAPWSAQPSIVADWSASG